MDSLISPLNFLLKVNELLLIVDLKKGIGEKSVLKSPHMITADLGLVVIKFCTHSFKSCSDF